MMPVFWGKSSIFFFNNGDRTEWSPIRSVIIWGLTLDDTNSCYQLIKTMTKFEKETRHRLYFFIKKKHYLDDIRDNSSCTWCVLSTYTGMTCELSLQLSYYTVQLQVWRLHCPLSAQIGMVITNHVREFFVMVLNNCDQEGIMVQLFFSCCDSINPDAPKI